ncbi:MAG: chromosomal replication initiator protein DnaA [Bacteroidaceae bacterium]|nr:chromosomal replication initiator protein DnaA [Bacteroidaceae bacterium]
MEKISAKEKWDNCLSFIRNNLDEQTYERWFAPIKFYSYSEGVLVLYAPNEYFIECVEGNFLNLLRQSIKKNFGNIELGYNFQNSQEGQDVVTVAETPRSSVVGTSRGGNEVFSSNLNDVESDLDSQLSPDNRFENFIEGDSNKLPLTIALSIAEESYKNTFNPFFIFGPSGVGKTHLANAIGVRIKENNPKKRVLYVSAHMLQMQYTDSVLRNKFNDFMGFYQSIDTLIIDDIQEISGKTKTQEAFFNIFNNLHRNKRQLIITSDRPPVLLEGMTERLLTRFNWGILAELEQPDAKLRKDILRFKVKRDGLQFPENVINYIAQHVTGSVRNLEGIINSIIADSIVTSSDIDLALAEKVISRVVPTKLASITIDQIIDTVCKHFSIKPHTIISTCRKQDIVQARQISMYLSQKFTPLSSSQIGARIHRDHSTVLHSCNLVESRMGVDKKYRAEIEKIEKSLKGKK